MKRTNNVLFALHDEKPVGMIAFIIRNSENSKHIADILRVYLEKKYRGKGIGDKLFNNAISSIRKNSYVSKVALSVAGEQVPAVNLYLKNNSDLQEFLKKNST